MSGGKKSEGAVFMESRVTYFEERKPENTGVTFKLARERMQALGIKKLVLASTTGQTAAQALDFFKDDQVRLVVVPHQYDFVRRENPFDAGILGRLRESGHVVHFGTMIFHTDKLFGTSIPTLMANLLRCFSQGVKVCFEIVLMATDGGHLARGEKIVAIAGTARGADTALVMQAASSQNLGKLRVNEIICKPLNPLNIDELKAEKDRKGD
jgi:hypothetical protein